MVDLNEIVVFARVVQAGSFSGAARLLDMPKSTVSRKVSELEDRIGARLLHRTTRKLGLTEVGRLYYRHGERIVAEMDEAEQAVSSMQAAPRGLLRVTAPLGFGTLGPIVTEYLRQFPEVQIDLYCSDRRVDLVEEGFDLAIRAGPLTDSTLVARNLGTLKRLVVAAPAYCKKQGTPKVPADLKKHGCIVFGAGTTPNEWTLEAKGESLTVRVKARATINDFDVLGEVTRAAVGIACIPEHVCAADLAAGRLRRVLPEWSSPGAPLHAVHPSARHLSPKVVAFIELIRKMFAASTS